MHHAGVVLDTATLRVAFAVVGLCVVILFYGATYRTTRSAYSGWWCVSLGLFLVSATLFLLDGTDLQVVAEPLGNGVAVLGAGGVWAASRSLRGTAVRRWQLGVLPAVVTAASFLDDPAHDVWTGAPFYFAGMAIALGLSTYELSLLVRGPTPIGESRAQYRFVVFSLIVVSGTVAVYYFFRAAAFVAVGPDDRIFEVWFGSQATTLLTMVLLVVVTFSMSELSHDQQTADLRERASHDGLTGVLNRSEFLRRADAILEDPPEEEGGTFRAFMVADLDGFKALNDEYGHAAGDAALVAFAAACTRAVGSGGIVGRLGGDEFAMLLLDGTGAEQVATRISEDFTAGDDGGPKATVSFGIATTRRDVDAKDTILRADIALYQAKAAGRDRVVRYSDAAT